MRHLAQRNVLSIMKKALAKPAELNSRRIQAEA
jgi:hypothetical protein